MTPQSLAWSSDFGRDYTYRNLDVDPDTQYRKMYGITRTEINEQFISCCVDKDARILEVGCNVGRQLGLLAQMGFTDLWGCDVNQGALDIAAERYPSVQFVCANALELPFQTRHFEMVFTAGVLIHIAPEDLAPVMIEILRCSNRFVHGHEYYADTYQPVDYQGKKQMLWKGDFRGMYKKLHPYFTGSCLDLPNLDGSGNVDQVFTLERI